MEITKIEQLLIDFLASSKASKTTQAIAFIILKEEAQELEMCRFLSKNETATDEEIMAAAKRIAGE